MKAGLDPRPPGSSCVKISSPCGISAADGNGRMEKGMVFFGEGKRSPFSYFFGGRLLLMLLKNKMFFWKGFES